MNIISLLFNHLERLWPHFEIQDNAGIKSNKIDQVMSSTMMEQVLSDNVIFLRREKDLHLGKPWARQRPDKTKGLEQQSNFPPWVNSFGSNLMWMKGWPSNNARLSTPQKIVSNCQMYTKGAAEKWIEQLLLESSIKKLFQIFLNTY